METSKCWVSGSSGLPEVNVDVGCWSGESDPCNRAKDQEESPRRKDREDQTLQSDHLCGSNPPAKDASEDTQKLPFPSGDATGFLFKDGSILSWLLG